MAYIITFAFIILDFVTGIIKAFAKNEFSSTRMREGLFHKVGLLIAIVLGVLVDVGQGYMDLGVYIPVANAISVYVCFMEISSIIENICKINPDIMPDKLNAIFGELKNKELCDITSDVNKKCTEDINNKN